MPSACSNGKAARSRAFPLQRRGAVSSRIQIFPPQEAAQSVGRAGRALLFGAQLFPQTEGGARTCFAPPCPPRGTREAFLKDFEGFSPLMRILSALESGAERRLVEQRRGGNLLKDQNSSPSAAAEGALRPRSTKKAMAATARMPKISAAISIPESAEELSSSTGSSSAGAETSVR